MAKQRYKKIQAGPLVREVVWTPVFDHRDPAERAGRQSVTTAARRRINLKKSSEQLGYLMAANFTTQDAIYTLTFDNDHLPASGTDARKIMKKFLREIRQELRSQGRELKYVYAMEGKHGSKRLHFHIVLNMSVAERGTIKAHWPYGYSCGQQIDVRQFRELGKYLTKEAREDGARVGAHSWSASRNLSKPVVSPTEWVPDSVRLEPPANAYILEREEKVNEYGRFCYVEYILPDPPQRSVRPPIVIEYPN